MGIIKKKTKKKLSKHLNKVIRKHGPEVATALAISIVTGLIGSKVGENGVCGDDNHAKPKADKHTKQKSAAA